MGVAAAHFSNKQEGVVIQSHNTWITNGLNEIIVQNFSSKSRETLLGRRWLRVGMITSRYGDSGYNCQSYGYGPYSFHIQCFNKLQS